MLAAGVESPSSPWSPGHFVVCPLAVQPPILGASAGAWPHELYRVAFEQARLALAPPRFERAFLASWN
jgi:hypothetical protein